MGILKETFVALLMLVVLNLFGQDNDKLITVFSESYKLEESGDYKNAIAKLKLVYDEKSYELNLRLGWLTYTAGSYIESTTYYTKAIALMPYAIEPYFGIAYPLAEMGKIDEVKKHYNKILEIDPNNTLASYRLGLVYYNNQDYNNAAKYFEKVVNLFPFDYDGLVMLAWCRLKQQNYREARIFFQKSLMRKPDDKSALEGLRLLK